MKYGLKIFFCLLTSLSLTAMEYPLGIPIPKNCFCFNDIQMEVDVLHNKTLKDLNEACKKSNETLVIAKVVTSNNNRSETHYFEAYHLLYRLNKNYPPYKLYALEHENQLMTRLNPVNNKHISTQIKLYAVYEDFCEFIGTDDQMNNQDNNSTFLRLFMKANEPETFITKINRAACFNLINRAQACLALGLAYKNGSIENHPCPTEERKALLYLQKAAAQTEDKKTSCKAQQELSSLQH